MDSDEVRIGHIWRTMAGA